MDALQVVLHLPREGLIHAGFAIFACGFLVRSALRLRVLAVSGYIVFVTFALTSMGSTRWHFLGWYIAFIAFNAAHAIRLAHARRTPNLKSDEQRLVQLAFPAADANTIARLLRKGRWLSLQPGECLTRQGEACGNVYVIVEGEVAIDVDGTVIARAASGQFLGEVSFLVSAPASATARAEAPGVRVLAWAQQDLLALMKASPGIGAIIHAAFGRDLARKIAAPRAASC